MNYVLKIRLEISDGFLTNSDSFVNLFLRLVLVLVLTQNFEKNYKARVEPKILPFPEAQTK